MSLIFPKKEILYAPMLGTLGGGSARGFGQGVSSGIKLYESGLWAMGDGQGTDGYGMVRYDPNNFDRLVTSNTVPVSGSYPSTMADTYRNSSGTVYLIGISGSNIYAYSSSSLNQITSTNIIYDTRGMMVHGDYAYVAPNNHDDFRRYSLSSISNISLSATVYNGAGVQDWEGMVAVGGYLYFGGRDGWIAVVQESNFQRQTTTRVNSNTNEITAMCYGANGYLYAGYNNGDIVRFNSYPNGMSATHQYQSAIGIVEDLEVDRFGNIHVIMRGQTNAYLVLDQTLTFVAQGNLPMQVPTAILINDYVYIGDHTAVGQHYKYYVPDVIAGTFSPTNAGTKYGPTTNTLLSSYNQSDLHQKNLEQGGLSF